MVYFDTILSLVFVIGLILLVAYVSKKYGVSGVNSLINKANGKTSRLEVVESKRIDARTNLVLVKKDDKEHLIVVGFNKIKVIE